MSDTKVLLGAISNDLFRIANYTHKNSINNALIFANEANKSIEKVKDHNYPQYLKSILIELNEFKDIKQELADKYLMSGILLQNYVAKSIT
jgi:hypothetical protein